ncbi:hypothetical protein L7F22_057157 [Adiantum nelumboides]|nr:hypothetical protein [Adiantum nelumboides]
MASLIKSVGFLCLHRSAESRLAHGCSLQRKHETMAMAVSTDRADEVRFDLSTFLETKKSSIASALDQAIVVQRPTSIYESMRYSVFADSSRVCPLLCISACELVGGSSDLAMPTACALDMVHTASFIHDDLPCMDDDELRRGKAANHKVFGEDLAILAGDALYALGVEHVAANSKGVYPDKLLRVIAELGKAVGSEGMVAGQFLELASNENGEELTFEALQDIHLRKTAAYAECSTVCGAILGGADEEQIQSLRQYGRALGLLYEVVVDMTEQQSKDSSKLPSSYIKVLGLEKCKEYGKKLRSEAKSYLSGFDAKKALPLLCFVDQLADRVGNYEDL